MEEDKQERQSHAKAQRRKALPLAPLRLCVRYFSSLGFVLCFALLVRGGTLWLTPNALVNDPDGYLRLATNLVTFKTFGAGTTLTAYRPPLYPIVLSPCVAVGVGNDDVVEMAIMALHVLLGAATVGLVWLLAQQWGLGRGGAALAAILVACDPILLASSTLVMTETLATFLATAGLVVLTWAGRERTIAGSQQRTEFTREEGSLPRAVGPWSLLRYAIAGAVLALASLCRPAFLLWTLAAGVVLLWQAVPKRPLVDENSRGPMANGRIANNLRISAAFAVGVLLTLSPWAIRNALQLDRPMVTTTHGGYTLYLANNPDFYNWLRHGSWGSVWWSDQFDRRWENRVAEWKHQGLYGECEADRACSRRGE